MSEAAYVQVQPHTACTIALVTCEKVGGRESQIIEQEIRGALAASLVKKHRLVVDMAQVTMLASMGLGALVNLHKLCAEQGGRLAVCNLHPEIRQVLKITRLDQVLKIVTDRESAIKAMS